MTLDSKSHWENVYKTKNPEQVSWTQELPKTSLDFIRSFGLHKSARIIDIGGGDSKLADYLLEEGFENITVLDISAKALERAQERLGIKASKITWIVSDINTFEPETTYDVWHDRAAFHFLTAKAQIDRYVTSTKNAVSGFLILGTFSEAGPTQCSGLDVMRYNKDTLATTFAKEFDKINCITEDHKTPFGTRQNFLFCSFKKKIVYLHK